MDRFVLKILLLATLSTWLLAGCMDPRKTPPARQRVDQEDLQKAGYMARFMLPYDNRQWFLRDLKQANFAASGSDYDAVTTTIGIPAPKWMTKGENNARLCVGGTLRRTTEGQMALTEVEGVGTIASHYCNSRFVSLDEQRLLRTLSDDGYFFYGNTRTANILALNGRLYQVPGRRYNRFVTYEILAAQVAQR